MKIGLIHLWLTLKKIKMDILKFDLLDVNNIFNNANDLLLYKNPKDLAKYCKKNLNENLVFELMKTKEWIDKFLLTLDK